MQAARLSEPRRPDSSEVSSQRKRPKSSGSKWLPVPQPRARRSGKRQRWRLVVSHGRPAEAEACIRRQHVKTRAYRRDLTPLTRRQSWLMRGYQRRICCGKGRQRELTGCARIGIPIRKTARLLSQTGGGVAVRLDGALRRRPSPHIAKTYYAWGWPSEGGGGVGRVRCCAMNWSNSSLSLA